MYSIVCPACGAEKLLNSPERFDGRQVKYTCTNPQCLEEVVHSVRVPKATSTGTAVFTDTSLAGKIGRLTMMDPPLGAESSFMLGPGDNYVGRRSSQQLADIKLPTKDVHMSRKHCVIRGLHLQAQDLMLYTIKDLESKNGVMVNDRRVQQEEEIYLEHGDTIRLGNTYLKFDLV